MVSGRIPARQQTDASNNLLIVLLFEAPLLYSHKHQHHLEANIDDILSAQKLLLKLEYQLFVTITNYLKLNLTQYITGFAKRSYTHIHNCHLLI